MLLLLLLCRHHRRVRRFRRGLHGLHTVAPGFTTTMSCRSPTLAPLASLNIHCQLLQVTVSLARMSDDPIAGRKFVPGFAASPRLRPLGLSHFHSQPSPPTTRTLTLSFVVVVIFTSRPRQKKQRLRASERRAFSRNTCSLSRSVPGSSSLASPKLFLPLSSFPIARLLGNEVGLLEAGQHSKRGRERRDGDGERGESCRRISCSPAAVADAPRRPSESSCRRMPTGQVGDHGRENEEGKENIK